MTALPRDALRPRAVIDRTAGAFERLARIPGERWMMVVAIAWIWFVITGLRMPWQPIVVTDENGGGGTRQAFFTLCAGVAIFRMVSSGSLSQVLGHQLGPMLLGLLMIGSTLYSNDPVLTVKRSIVYWFGFLSLACTVHSMRDPCRFYLRALVYTTGFAAVVSLLAYFGLPKACTTIEMRPGLAGVTVHPNVFGPCLQIAILLSLGVPSHPGRERLILRVCQVSMALALLMSNSMTATLATFAGVGIYIMFTTRSYTAGLIQIGCLGVVGLAAMIGVSELKAMFFAASGRDENLSGRDVLWGAVYREGMKSPIFGTGYGSFWYEGRGREITGTWNPRQSHNAYLDVFVDLGIVGALFVIGMTHVRYIGALLREAGPRGSARRSMLSAIMTMALALCYVGAFGESFLLKLDKFQFVAFLWGAMVLGNMDSNGLRAELKRLDAEFPVVERRRVRTLMGRLWLGSKRPGLSSSRVPSR